MSEAATTPPLTTFNPEHHAHCRAIILQAINAKPGMTYTEIRKWVEENKRFTMEDVGRRVRELARDLAPHYATIRYDEKGHAHVYPAEE